MATNGKSERNDRKSSRGTSAESRLVEQFMEDIVILYIVGDNVNINFLTELPSRAETWKIGEVRRHWPLKDHCGYWLFPCQYPLLALTSEVGRYFWNLHCTSCVPTPVYNKNITRCVALTVTHLNNYKKQIIYLVFCDIMFNINWLDYQRRLFILDQIRKFIGYQSSLRMVSLENAGLDYAECIQIMTILGKTCSQTLKRLYLWKAFTFNHMKDCSQFEGETIAVSRCTSYLTALSLYTNLRVLAVNFSYLIGNDGETLLSLGSITVGYFRELQLLCLKEDLSIITSLFEQEEEILPDSTWRKAREKCPHMRVYMVIFCIPQHDLSVKFLSPSMPLCAFHLSSGIEAQQLCWHVDITMRILITWYPLLLECLYLHLWQNRDILDGILLNDCLESFPNLKTLEFIGIMHNENTIEKICKKIKDSDDLALRKLLILMQGTPSKDMSDLKKELERIQHDYQDVLSEKNVHLKIGFYRC